MESFNEEIEKVLLHDINTNGLNGRVCVVCDKYMNRKETKLINIKKSSGIENLSAKVLKDFLM